MFRVLFPAGKHAASLLAQEVQLAGEAAEEARKNRAWAGSGCQLGHLGFNISPKNDGIMMFNGMLKGIKCGIKCGIKLGLNGASGHVTLRELEKIPSFHG